MNYKILTASRFSNYHEVLNILQERVDLLLKDGWKPLGGVSFTSTKVGFKTSYIIAQAMIKED